MRREIVFDAPVDAVVPTDRLLLACKDDDIVTYGHVRILRAVMVDGDEGYAEIVRVAHGVREWASMPFALRLGGHRLRAAITGPGMPERREVYAKSH